MTWPGDAKCWQRSDRAGEFPHPLPYPSYYRDRLRRAFSHRYEVSLRNPHAAVPKTLPSQTFLFVGRLQRPTSSLPMCRKGSSFLSAGGSKDSSRTQKTLLNSRRLTRFPSALKLHRCHRHYYALSTGIQSVGEFSGEGVRDWMSSSMVRVECTLKSAPSVRSR